MSARQYIKDTDVELRVGITDQHLREIYADPFVQRIATDSQPGEPFIHPLVTYLSAFVRGKFVGAFMAIRQMNYDMEVHVLLMKEAIPQSRKLAQKFLDWVFAQNVLRATAQIYSHLPSVKNFCLKLGFQYEGFRRLVDSKDGKPIGLHMLGLTIYEWEGKK